LLEKENKQRLNNLMRLLIEGDQDFENRVEAYETQTRIFGKDHPAVREHGKELMQTLLEKIHRLGESGEIAAIEFTEEAYETITQEQKEMIQLIYKLLYSDKIRELCEKYAGIL